MKKIQVLVADDERIERSILCRRLSREFGDDCDIIQVENGKEAVARFQEQPVQIAILDISMPGMNGMEAAARIREMDENCIIIFLTAYSDFQYTRQAIRLRALDYLTKPYDMEELFSVMETALYQVQAAKPKMQTSEPKVQAEKTQISAEEDNNPQISQNKIKEISDFISQNYMHDISMQDAAQFMNYSDTYFCKLFKHGFGSNFTTYLTKYRIREAQRLLKITNFSIKEISTRIGYADSNYFTKVFKRQMGMNPSEYRDSILNQTEVRL